MLHVSYQLDALSFSIYLAVSRQANALFSTLHAFDMYLLTHTGGYIIAQGDDEANKRSRSSPTQMESSHSSALSSRVHRDRARK